MLCTWLKRYISTNSSPFKRREELYMLPTISRRTWNNLNYILRFISHIYRPQSHSGANALGKCNVFARFCALSPHAQKKTTNQRMKERTTNGRWKKLQFEEMKIKYGTYLFPFELHACMRLTMHQLNNIHGNVKYAQMSRSLPRCLCISHSMI